MNKTMRMTKTVVAVTIFAGALSACAPRVMDEVVEIQPNQTAFLIQLDGNTMNQNKLQSIEYLQKNLIATKRVIIPHKLIDICNNCVGHEWKDVATEKLLLVDRTPVTREWTSDNATGTSKSNEAFSVESNESIDFSIGANMTAHISEDDAAKFLYNYGGKSLSQVADEDIRQFISTHLSNEFGSNSLDYDRLNKVAIFNKTFEDAKVYYSAKGVTIDRIGFTEGMNYHDINIQKSINQRFEADMQVDVAKKTLEAAQINAQAKEAVQAQQAMELKRREQDIEMAKVNKWDGHNSQSVTYVNTGGEEAGKTAMQINVK